MSIPEILSLSEVARRLPAPAGSTSGRRIRFVQDLIARGELPFVTISPRVRGVLVSDFARYIEERRTA